MPSCLCEMPVAEDMRAVPTYAQRFTGGNGLITLNPNRIARADSACTEWPEYLGTKGLIDKLNPCVCFPPPFPLPYPASFPPLSHLPPSHLLASSG